MGTKFNIFHSIFISIINHEFLWSLLFCLKHVTMIIPIKVWDQSQRPKKINICCLDLLVQIGSSKLMVVWSTKEKISTKSHLLLYIVQNVSYHLTMTILSSYTKVEELFVTIHGQTYYK